MYPDPPPPPEPDTPPAPPVAPLPPSPPLFNPAPEVLLIVYPGLNPLMSLELLLTVVPSTLTN